MRISARFPGVCKVTGRRYAEGAALTKTEYGWAIDDDATAAALAAVGEATHRILADYDWTVGQVVDARGGIWKVLLLMDEADYAPEAEDEFVTRIFAKVRVATDEEAAPILERRAAKMARRALLKQRAEAEKALLALDREQVSEFAYRHPEGWVFECRLVESNLTGYTYSPPSWTVHLYADGSVYLSHYNPDWGGRVRDVPLERPDARGARPRSRGRMACLRARQSRARSGHRGRRSRAVPRRSRSRLAEVASSTG